MAALAPGLYRVTLFASLGNENVGRFSLQRFDSALASGWSPTGPAVSIDGVQHNPNTTVAQARNCGRLELRSNINIIVKPGSNVEKIDLIRDVIRAVGAANGIVRNAALESVWFTGRPAAADSACAADLTRGSFTVTHRGVIRSPSASQRTVPPSPPPPAAPVSLADRIASGGSTVQAASNPAEMGTVNNVASISTVTDTVSLAATSTGIPAWAIGLGIVAVIGGAVFLMTRKD